MADKDITNRQLLSSINTRFDGLETRIGALETRFDGLEGKFDGLETRFDKLEEMLSGVKSVVVGIANDMATGEELNEFREELHADFENLELRLGRRIDATFSMKTAKPSR